MKPSAAEKPVKQPAKMGTKVFDIAHPGKSTPSSTSRPVIVTNRPLLQDPMVSDQSENLPSAPKLNPAAVKVTIKPLSGADEPADSNKPTKPAKEEKDKTIAELAEEKAIEKSVEKAAAKTDKPSTEADDKKSGATSDDSSEEGAAEAAADKEDTPAAEDHETKAEPSEADESSSEDGSEVAVEDAKAAKETAELEAEAKKLEGINALVESRQYFLPINAVERHRSKVFAIVGLILIVALGLMLLDLLLDVGFIRIDGVHSLTHFFSSIIRPY